MYPKQSKLDKTTDVVDFSFSKGTFNYLGIEFQIYSDRKNPNTPDLALKRNDTTPHKRLSGLFQEGATLRGDIRTSTQKRYFTIEISEDKKQVNLIGFRDAIELIGISTPIEQIELFRGVQGGSERGIYSMGATGLDYQERGLYISA
jgi:hypothetical protein